MGKLKDAVAALDVHRGPPCGVAVLRATLPADELAEFDELVAGSTYATHIVGGLKSLGYSLKSDALQRHRRKLCECQKAA